MKWTMASIIGRWGIQMQKRRQKKFHEEWVNVYRLKFPVLIYICWHVCPLLISTPTVHFKTKTKTLAKTKTMTKRKTKTKFSKDPTWAIPFEKLRVQGYQIWHSCIKSASSVHFQCIISASSVHHRCIISESPDQIRPDQTRTEKTSMLRT